MLRVIAEEEIPVVVRLMNEAYRGQGEVESWSTEVAFIQGDRTSEATLRSEIAEKPKGSMLVWDHQGLIQGCVWVEPASSSIWYLGSLAVDPRLQKAGLGRRLLHGAEEWITEHGGTRVQMTVLNLRDTLLAWYDRRGYRATGEKKPFPYEDGRFGTPVRDDLEFLVLEKRIA
jgi:GNAT superfamily N-acetyltransferase